MTQGRQRTNPFYILLIVTGVVFAITACGFSVMTFTDIQGLEGRGSLEEESVRRMADHPLFKFLDEHGTKTLLIELAVLAVATFGCMTTDTWYERNRALTGISERQGDTNSGTDEPMTPVDSLE